jgi:hypothetical protein
MSRRRGLAASVAAGALAVGVSPGAFARVPIIVYQATRSGVGANIIVGLLGTRTQSTSYLIEVTTKPSGLSINVSWALACGAGPGSQPIIVRAHSPFRRLVHCPTPKLAPLDVAAQLTNQPAAPLSMALSNISGRITLVVSQP